MLRSRYPTLDRRRLLQWITACPLVSS